MRRTLLSLAAGLIAGSIAVLALWLAGPPQFAGERSLPAVVRLDGWDEYARGLPIQDRSEGAERAERAMAAPLARPLRVENGSLSDAFDALSGAAGVPFRVEWEALNADPAFHPRPVTLWADAGAGSAADHLDGLLAGNPQFPIGADWYVDGGAVVITSRERAYSTQPVVTRVYDVRDLLLESARVARELAPAFGPALGQVQGAGATGSDGRRSPASERDAADALIDAVEALVESDPSRRVQGRRVAYWGGRLFVVDTPASQRTVAGELARLRGLTDPPAAGGR